MSGAGTCRSCANTVSAIVANTVSVKVCATENTALRVHVVNGQEIPRPPELAHLRRRAQGHTDVRVECGEGPRDEDALRPEMLDDVDGRLLGVEHHEVGLRINRS